MAVELTAYAAPLAGGVALVAPPNALAAIEAAGRVLAARPQATRLTVLTASSVGTDLSAHEVRGFIRRAATRATLPRLTESVGPRGRRHIALVLCGWLLILGGGGSAAAALAGVWLAIVYPLLRRTVLRREVAAFAQPAAQLGNALGAAPLETREHAGLTALAQIINRRAGAEAGAEADAHDGAPAERYRHAAAACAQLGLSPLGEFYEALARGAQPAMPWGALQPPDQPTDRPEPLEGHASTSSAETDQTSGEATSGAIQQPA